MKVMFFTVFVFLQLRPSLSLVADGLFSKDQKANCSKYVTGSFCYGGPRFDTFGQYKSCTVPGTIAFTFDDGPDPVGTPIILDIAKKYGLKVTFFVIGSKLIPAVQPIVQRIVDEGHQLASHTHRHPWLSSMNALDQETDLLQFESTLVSLKLNGVMSEGKIPSYLRAPHGSVNNETLYVVDKLGYKLIHWGYLNGDTTTPYNVSEEDVLNIHYEHFGGMNGTGVSSNVSVIIQQHDTKSVTYKSFETIAKYFKETFGPRGIRFTTIAECLGNIAPAYRKNRYTVESDPKCSKGIVGKQDTCCHVSCTRCGGDACSSLPGGSSKCCGSSILTANVSCDNNVAPCVINKMSLIQSSSPIPTIVSDPKCSSGLIGKQNTCCPASCTHCGGDACSSLPGGSSNCCGSSILTANVSCDISVAPCVINGTSLSPSPIIKSDPTCIDGLVTQKYCCPKSCTRCGGSDCSLLPGGSTNCCGGSILAAGRFCKNSTAPCLLA